jgi:hypothetical protein
MRRRFQAVEAGTDRGGHILWAASKHR